MVTNGDPTSDGTLPTSADWGIADSRSVDQLLRLRAQTHPDWQYIRWHDGSLTFRAFEQRVDHLARGLAAHGLKQGDHVAVMMDRHIDHIASIFALARLGAVNVPINPQHKGRSLEFLLSDSDPAYCLVDVQFSDQLQAAMPSTATSLLVERGGTSSELSIRFEALTHGNTDPISPRTIAPADTAVLLYTSGTTGMPKGVPMSDSMMRASAIGCLELSGISEGSVLHFWDPLYHVFGVETLILAVMAPAQIALVRRFSASRFWNECREFGATHIHYVGSILPILLKNPETASDRDHTVHTAWGGGCPKSIWDQFETRFGCQVREGYGLTETSSFCLVNTNGPTGSVGKPLAYFEVDVLDDNGTSQPDGCQGQLAVTPTRDGVLFTGYRNRPDATDEALAGKRFLTGDIGLRDHDGYYYFVGRQKNMIRRKGENISADAIEDVVGQHSDVEECAVIAVPSDIGEDELKLFVLPKSDTSPTYEAVWKWCQDNLSSYMIPRFISMIDQFEKTPTHRIRKELLSTDTADCWDSMTNDDVNRSVCTR